jgi:hypothetical protein
VFLGLWFLLQTVQGRQQRFERTGRQGLRGFVFFVLLKSTQTLRLKHALGLVAEQHCVTVESNAHFVGVGVAGLYRLSQHPRRRKAGAERLAHVLVVGREEQVRAQGLEVAKGRAALGEDTARSLGMPLGWARCLLITAFALATGAAVAQVGLVAFVGLAAPHLVRSLSPTGYRWHLPLSALTGALLLLLADLLARVLMAPQDIPVGVLTAVLGGGYLLLRMSRLSGGGVRS